MSHDIPHYDAQDAQKVLLLKDREDFDATLKACSASGKLLVVDYYTTVSERHDSNLLSGAWLMALLNHSPLSITHVLCEITQDVYGEMIILEMAMTCMHGVVQWCGPCKLVAPQVEQMAADFEGKGVQVCKVTCDASNENKKCKRRCTHTP